MPTPPGRKIYHIVHADNLAGIAAHGLLSDAAMGQRGGPAVTIGMNTIKARRLTLPVGCHPGSRVGEYVPFYLCPRSVMLYVLHCANHQELAYRDGQGPIVHLVADLAAVITWATAAHRRWAVSLSNAGARYAQFRHGDNAFDEINWPAVDSHQWAAPEIKEAKQAEFLVEGSFPWSLVTGIGVRSLEMCQRVGEALAACQTDHVPPVTARPNWYY